MVDSCLACASCLRGDEQMCLSQVQTYGGVDRSGRAAPGPGAPAWTLGGYTTRHVVHERFAIIIPPSYPLEFAGPIMCAGVTLFDPLRRAGAGPGTRVGVVGLGGLGGMGVKLAVALGCTVTAVTTSASKADKARAMGASAVLLSGDAAAMAAAAGSLDLVLNTIPGEHALGVYTRLLAPRGKHVVLGLHNGLVAGFIVDALSCHTSAVKGSGIGSIAATQAAMDLCAAHNIRPDIEVVGARDIGTVYEALSRANSSGVRYVLDLATLTPAAEAWEPLQPPKLGPHGALTFGGIVSSLLKIMCCSRRG